jgi:2-oxoisovalerate dehydrogenase E1 component
MTKPLPPIRSQDLAFAAEMLARMAHIRAFEAKAWALTQVNPARVPGSMHFCAGQEAVPLGAVAGLRADDPLLATYRGHGWALASGLSPRAVMAEICQKAEGMNGGRGGSAYMMAPDTRFIGENSIVGAGTTIACGVAMAGRAKGTGRVVTVSVGDGAMNQGSVHEAMAFAAAFRLPVIFVVENNGWAELTPTSRMTTVDRLAKRGAGYAIPSATIDGSDPIAVRDSFAQAAEHARSGQGPSLPRIPGAAPLGPLQPRHRALPPQGGPSGGRRAGPDRASLPPPRGAGCHDAGRGRCGDRRAERPRSRR